MRRFWIQLPGLTVWGVVAVVLLAGCGRANRSPVNASGKTPAVTPTSATLEEGLSEVEILVERGNRLIATDKPEAVRLLSEAIQKDSGHERARSIRGLVLAELNRDDEAYADAEYLRERRSLYAGPIEAVLKLKSFQYVTDADKQLAAGDADAALKNYETAIRFYGSNAGGLAGRGRVRVQRQQWTDAEADFAHALQLDGSCWMAHFGRAELQLAQGNASKAKEEVDRAIQLAPNESALYRVRAQAYRAQGDAAAAERELREADRIDTENRQSAGT